MAAYRLSDGQAVLLTADFFTPIVDDPFMFGSIAAANALSDIYAKGARPLFAINLVGFPVKKLPQDILLAILRGGAEKAREAGIPVIGGHSIDDPEPKYGLCVVAVADPKRIVRNSTARPGDVLVLTKPLGTGVITTAVKRGKVSPDVARCAEKVMCALNAAAAEAMNEVPVHACTDVTGFGLLGHLSEITRGSRVSAVVYPEQVPLISGLLQLADQNIFPGGAHSNFVSVETNVRWHGPWPKTRQLILTDPQTSGGLLMSVPRASETRILEALQQRGVHEAAVIGEIKDGNPGHIDLME